MHDSSSTGKWGLTKQRSVSVDAQGVARAFAWKEKSVASDFVLEDIVMCRKVRRRTNLDGRMFKYAKQELQDFGYPP